jgi:DNA-binding MurR/RpiR family transcriptional regulator
MDDARRPAPPASLADLNARLAALGPGLPRRLQQCADHLAAHPDQIALSTVAKVAQAAGVAPSALMRFCQHLGFSGYAEMQRLYREALARRPPDYATRLANLKSRGADHPAALLAEVVEAGRRSLENLAGDLEENTLNQAVDLLAAARTMHLAGFRRSFPVAAYFAYVGDKLGLPVVLHDGVAGLAASAALRPGDALLAITFAPYAEETLALARTARAAGLPVVLMTDPPATRVAPLANCVLTVREVDFGAFRSLSAAIALSLALALAVAARRDE